MSWLLLFIPITVALENLAPSQHLLIFATSAFSIMPLAGWMVHATEALAEHLGEGVGGLLNATFGNAAELIIALTALRAGLFDVVKASIAGAIVGNALMVLGLSMLAGGLRRPEQTFNATAARSQATMLTLAAIALIMPAAYRGATATTGSVGLGTLSVAMSVTLLAVYALNLVFSLITHRKLFAGSGETAAAPHPQTWGMGKASLVLGGATVMVAWMSEILVGAIDPAAEALGINDLFVGVFVVAVLGNAAEYLAAIKAAVKDRMDMTLSIAMGASVQVALFVAPILVLLSYLIAPAPMDLAFSGGLVLIILLAVLICGQVASDGRSDWLKGVQLVAVYILLGLTFFFAPTGR